MTQTPTPPPAPPAAETAAPPRRGFFAAAVSIVVGGFLGLAPVAAGIAFFLNPLLRKRAAYKGGSGDGYLPVARLAEIPSDGTPLRFAIVADKIDAWNVLKNQTIGAVYLRNIAGNVIAFNDVCPHLGCKVDYKASQKSFYCPCHASAFNLEGEKQNQIPPRNMDALDVRVEADGQVWVKYANYKRGVAEKVVLP